MSRYTHLKMQELILSGEIYISMNYENEIKKKILTNSNTAEQILRVSLLVLGVELRFIMNCGCTSIDAVSRQRRHFDLRHQRLRSDSNYLIEGRSRKVGWRICYWSLETQHSLSMLLPIFGVFGEMERDYHDLGNDYISQRFIIDWILLGSRNWAIYA